MDGLPVINFGSASFSFAVRQICYGRCGALSSLVVKLRRWRMAAGDDIRRSDFCGNRRERPSLETAPLLLCSYSPRTRISITFPLDIVARVDCKFGGPVVAE
jgi:hypothetical protein